MMCNKCQVFIEYRHALCIGNKTFRTKRKCVSTAIVLYTSYNILSDNILQSYAAHSCMVAMEIGGHARAGLRRVMQMVQLSGMYFALCSTF